MNKNLTTPKRPDVKGATVFSTSKGWYAEYHNKRTQGELLSPIKGLLEAMIDAGTATEEDLAFNGITLHQTPDKEPDASSVSVQAEITDKGLAPLASLNSYTKTLLKKYPAAELIEFCKSSGLGEFESKNKAVTALLDMQTQLTSE